MGQDEHLMIGFPIEEKLFNKAVEFVHAIEATDKPTKYANTLIDIIYEMTDVGLEYFFLESLRQAKIGKMSQGAIKMGLNSGKKAVLLVASKIIRSMNSEQMTSIAAYMKNILEQSNTPFKV